MGRDTVSGAHRLIHGDCLQVLPTLAAASVELVVADLPYGVTANPWDCAVPLPLLWDELLRVGTPRCVYVFTAIMRFACALIQSQPKMFRYDIVWEKSIPQGYFTARLMPLRAHELILVFCRKSAFYAPQKTAAPMRTKGARIRARETALGTNYGRPKPLDWRCDGTRFPRSVLKIDRDRIGGKARGIHPTQKPIALLAWLLRTYSAPGATVLDPTSGVASTAVAAARTGRRSVSIERDATYYARGVERLRAELAQQPLPPGAGNG